MKRIFKDRFLFVGYTKYVLQVPPGGGETRYLIVFTSDNNLFAFSCLERDDLPRDEFE